MGGELTPRQLLAEADAHRRVADAAEWAQTKIRLSETPVVTGGRLRFRRQRETDRELVFTPAETKAIYLALRQVRQNELRQAEDYESRVTTTGSS